MPGANGMTPRGLRMHDALKDSAGQRGRNLADLPRPRCVARPWTGVAACWIWAHS